MSGNPSLVKKKGAETSVVSAVLLVPFANTPCVSCCALCSPADRFYSIQAQFFPSLAATTEVQACLGSAGGAFIATQAGRKLYLSCASVQLMNVCTHTQRAFVEA